LKEAKVEANGMRLHLYADSLKGTGYKVLALAEQTQGVEYVVYKVLKSVAAERETECGPG
jgi:hypothetical protein